MSVYIVPDAGDFSEITEVSKKAGVEIISAQTIRQLIMETASKPIVISSIRGQDLLVLNRHAPTLIDELPTVVMSVPGIVYTGEWVSLASSFPAIDWTELASKLSKSGHLANTPEDLTKRTGARGEVSYDEFEARSRSIPDRPKSVGSNKPPSFGDVDRESEESDPDMEVS